MGVYKVFDGINWVDICDCNVHVKTITDWQKLNATECILRYWDGSEWCEVVCCDCPEGYIYDPEIRQCRKFEMIPATPSGGVTVPIVQGSKSSAYSDFGARLYEDISGKTYPLNGFQAPVGTDGCSGSACYIVKENAGTGTTLNIEQLSDPGNDIFDSQGTGIFGRLNASGIWATGYGINQWLTVEFCINISSEKTYIFAIAGDNQIRASITSSTFNGGVTDLNLVNLWCSNSPAGTSPSSSLTNTFKYWHMFPITLPAGSHVLKLAGYDLGVSAAFGGEIYDIPIGNPGDIWPAQQTLRALMTSSSVAFSDLEPFIVFSTKNLVTTPPLVIAAPGQTITWTCPEGYTLDFCNGVPACVINDIVPCGGLPPEPCQCPEGYFSDPETGVCTKVTQTPATSSGGIVYEIFKAPSNTAYGDFGVRLYNDISNKDYPINAWRNESLPNTGFGSQYQACENAGIGANIGIQATCASSVLGPVTRLNTSSLWARIPGSNPNPSNGYAGAWPSGQWFSVSYCIEIPEERQYIFALAGDNQIRASINSTTFNGGGTTSLVNLWADNAAAGPNPSGSYTEPFRYWHMFPITLPAGVHTLTLDGYNDGSAYSFGAEIYAIDEVYMENTIMTGGDDIEKYILFTTRQLITTPALLVGGPGQTITWTCPDGTTYSDCYGAPSCVVIETTDCI